MNTKKAYELIQNILSGLPEKSKQSVLNKLFSNEKSNADRSAEKQEQLLEKCRQAKMVDGKMVCPDCGSLNTIKNGFRSGRQRYLCKDCTSSFGDTNDTLFFHSRLSADKWEKLISMVLLKQSIRTIAKDLGIHKNTAMFNINRIATMLEEYANTDSEFISIVEADEWYYPLSFTGKRDKSFFIDVLGRMPRHHRSRAEKLKYLEDAGFDISVLNNIDDDQSSVLKQASVINHLVAEEKHKRGISNDLLAVLTCVDRTQSNFTKSCCLGRITTNDISTELKDCFAEDTVLVTDSHSAYRGYAKANGIHLEQIPSGQHNKGGFNLARVNSYHSRLTELNYPHKVIASKNCNRYFALYQWQDRNRSNTTKANTEKLINMACQKVKLFTRKNYGKALLPFDTKGLITMPV